MQAREGRHACHFLFIETHFARLGGGHAFVIDKLNRRFNCTMMMREKGDEEDKRTRPLEREHADESEVNDQMEAIRPNTNSW